MSVTCLPLGLCALCTCVAFTYCAGIPEVVTEVSTREGDNAVLPCAMDSPVNLKDGAFDWKKERQEVFFYEQGRHYNNGRAGQDPQFVGRVNLVTGGLQAGNASVILSSVTQRDSGEYKCVFLRPKSHERWIQLTVEEALTAASSDSDGRYSISQSVNVTEPGNYTCLQDVSARHMTRVVGYWLASDCEEVSWKAICVILSILFILLMLSFGAYKCFTSVQKSLLLPLLPLLSLLSH